MGLSAKLQMRQAQGLVMTPQLLQSIRLLQYTQAELELFIDEEIGKNPLLERAAADDGPIAPPEPAAEPSDADWISGDLNSSSGEMAERLDTTLENVFPDDPGGAGPVLQAQWRDGPSGSGEDFDLAELAAAPVTLRDVVTEQVAFAFSNPGDRLIAMEMADNLDDAGYLRADPDAIAAQLGGTAAQAAAVLAICQGFDPPGLFARSLAECLALQLKRRNRFDPAMQSFVANLELLAKRDFLALKRICGVDEDDLLDMAAELRTLDPKPGAAFGRPVADVIVPDIIVRSAPDGSWAVELNPDALPRVLVNQTYFARIKASAKAAPDKAFADDCLQSANWLVRSLDQRAKTILKVASEIVRWQDGFLLHGVSHLRPLNLRMVADAIGMHESTVSRVTANKFMATPRGVMELRTFFSAGLQASGGGEAHSADSVRHRIRLLVEAEAADGVLSDDALVDILKENGVDIARRTVAKYREGMNIPSSVQRRREKQALARAAGTLHMS